MVWSEAEKKQHFKRRIVHPWYHIVRHAKTKSRAKNIPCDLTYEWAKKRWTGFCEISGLKFEIGRSDAGCFSPSIDKIIPSLGYIQENCRFILFGINSLKGKENDDTVFKVCQAILDKTKK